MGGAGAVGSGAGRKCVRGGAGQSRASRRRPAAAHAGRSRWPPERTCGVKPRSAGPRDPATSSSPGCCRRCATSTPAFVTIPSCSALRKACARPGWSATAVRSMPRRIQPVGWSRGRGRAGGRVSRGPWPGPVRGRLGSARRAPLRRGLSAHRAAELPGRRRDLRRRDLRLRGRTVGPAGGRVHVVHIGTRAEGRAGGADPIAAGSARCGGGPPRRRRPGPPLVRRELAVGPRPSNAADGPRAAANGQAGDLHPPRGVADGRFPFRPDVLPAAAAVRGRVERAAGAGDAIGGSRAGGEQRLAVVAGGEPDDRRRPGHELQRRQQLRRYDGGDRRRHPGHAALRLHRAGPGDDRVLFRLHAAAISSSISTPAASCGCSVITIG